MKISVEITDEKAVLYWKVGKEYSEIKCPASPAILHLFSYFLEGIEKCPYSEVESRKKLKEEAKKELRRDFEALRLLEKEKKPK